MCVEPRHAYTCICGNSPSYAWCSAVLLPPAGEAITFFKEEDAGQLRSIAHVVKAAGSDVPDWMLALPKDKRHRKQQPQQAQQQLGSGAGEAGPPTGPSGGKPRQQQQQQGGSKQKKQKKPPQQGLRRPAKRAKQ